MERGDVKYRIVDTAGIRKKGKIEYGAEFFMVNRAFKAVKRAEVVVLLLDATDGIVEQDRILAERIATEGRSCVIALNKWDIVPEKDDKTYLQAIDNVRVSLPSLKWAEVVLISAKTGQVVSLTVPMSTLLLTHPLTPHTSLRHTPILTLFLCNTINPSQRTEKLFEAVDRASRQFSRRIPTAIINEVVQDATAWMAPPTVGSRAGRIYYCIQVHTMTHSAC